MHITVTENSLPFFSSSSVGSHLFVKLNISCLALLLHTSQSLLMPYYIPHEVPWELWQLLSTLQNFIVGGFLRIVKTETSQMRTCIPSAIINIYITTTLFSDLPFGAVLPKSSCRDNTAILATLMKLSPSFVSSSGLSVYPLCLTLKLDVFRSMMTYFGLPIDSYTATT